MLGQMQQEQNVRAEEAPSCSWDMLRRQEPLFCGARFALYLATIHSCAQESGSVCEMRSLTQVTKEGLGNAWHMTNVWCSALSSAALTNFFESHYRLQFLPDKRSGLCEKSAQDCSFYQGQANNEASQD